jgi:hypothetical protein
MRKYISILLAILIILGAVFAYKKLANSKKEKKHLVKNSIKIVDTKRVKNKTIPIKITASGTLKAKEKIDLFTEVQGVILKGVKEFNR